MKSPAPLARAEPARENEQARVQDRPVPFLPEKSNEREWAIRCAGRASAIAW